MFFPSANHSSLLAVVCKGFASFTVSAVFLRAALTLSVVRYSYHKWEYLILAG